MGNIVVRELTNIEQEVAGLAVFNVPPEIIAKRTGQPISVIRSMLNSDHIQAEIALLRARNAALGDNRLADLNNLAIERLFDILSIDYEYASYADKREIARTARFVVEMHLENGANQSQQLNQINNVVISDGSLETIARYLSVAQKTIPDDIINQYHLDSVAYTLSCSPGTEKGVVNYDPDYNTYQCHICGDWYSDLYGHIVVHNITAEQYKNIFEIYD